MLSFKKISLALATMGIALHLAPVVANAETGANIALIMDASGSMKAKLKNGTTRIEAARTAIEEFTKTLPSDSNISFRAYGHQSHRSEKNCKDTQMLVPFGKMSDVSGQIISAANGLEAQGYTPISHVLSLAAQDLATLEGTKTVVLVSDGKETCEADPCAVAKSLADNDVDLVIHAVGLGVDSQTKEQLQCIARVSRGEYYDANNASELNKSMTQAATTQKKPKQVVKLKISAGTLELVETSWNDIKVLDSETGEELGVISHNEPSFKIPAGIYDLQFHEGVVQKNVEVLAGEVTKVEPARVKLQMLDTTLFYVLEAESGKVLGSFNGYAGRPHTFPAGRYDIALGINQKMRISADLKAGELYEIPVGTLQIDGSHWDAEVKDIETDEALLRVSLVNHSPIMLAGKYNYGLGVGFKLNIPFEIKAGEETTFSPGGVKITPNGDYKIMSPDGEHVADHNKLVGQMFLPDGKYIVEIGGVSAPIEVKDNQMIEIEVE